MIIYRTVLMQMVSYDPPIFKSITICSTALRAELEFQYLQNPESRSALGLFSSSHFT